MVRFDVGKFLFFFFEGEGTCNDKVYIYVSEDFK